MFPEWKFAATCMARACREPARAANLPRVSPALSSLETLLRHPRRRQQGLALARSLAEPALFDALLEGARWRRLPGGAPGTIEAGPRWAALPREAAATLVLELALGAPPASARAWVLRTHIRGLSLAGPEAARLDLRGLPALERLRLVRPGPGVALRLPRSLRTLEIDGAPGLPRLGDAPGLAQLDLTLVEAADLDLRELPPLPALERFSLSCHGERFPSLPALERARRETGVAVRGLASLPRGLARLSLGGVRVATLMPFGRFAGLRELALDRLRHLESTEGVGALPLTRLTLSNLPELARLDELPLCLERLTLLDCPEAARAAERVRRARPGLAVKRLVSNVGAATW